MANVIRTTDLPFFIAPADTPRDEYAAGYDGNGFASRAEAEAAIDSLRELGGEWDTEWVVSSREVA